jgi:hypothetical protein
MISPSRIALTVLVAIGVTTFPAMTPEAEAEPNGALISTATNAIWLDYVRTHRDEDVAPPVFVPEAPPSSAAITKELMKGRSPSKHLHMIGDDHFNIEPRRIGPLGFGLSAGGEF